MKSKLLWAENIDFRRGQSRILQTVSLTLYEQEIVALIGGNGSGKTTLLEILMGILTPDRGKIYRAENIAASKKTSWLGYLPDKAPLYPHWQVQEFLTRCAQMRQVDSVDEVVSAIIQSCDLQAVAHSKCAALSHGYRQRVGLAQALIHKPAIVVLDEPTNGLDTKQKIALRPLLTGLKNHCSVLLTSHDWEEVIHIADRVYYLFAGKLYEIPLPPRNQSQLWAECENEKTAAAIFAKLTPQTSELLLDGRFIGFAHGHSVTILRQLWRQLSLEDGIEALHSSYPPNALQEKLNHVAQSHP